MVEPRKRKDRTSALVKRDGALAMTFVNTAAGSRRPLADYADLVAWARKHGALSPTEAVRVGRLASQRPEDAETAFAAAEDLREVLSRMFNAAADGEKPLPEAAESLNVFVLHTVPPRRFVVSGDRYSLDWVASPEEDLASPLWQVVQSATEVLTSEDCGRIVRCAGEGCGLLFLARNKGIVRKWCDASCSHRARSLRRYHDTVKPYKAEIRRKAKALLRKQPATGRGT